ncbi:MAG: HD-GYP domain-containing protein [bacterium]
MANSLGIILIALGGVLLASGGLLLRKGILRLKSYEEDLKAQFREHEDKLERTYLETLESFARLLELKDSYTAGHSERVKEYALMIGREMGLSREELKTLEKAGKFHDIGKVIVSNTSLRKNGPLSPVEQAEMRLHSTVGASVLESLEFLRGSTDIIRYHHERYDGDGYPEGLAGEKIPLGARIMAVADAYDAMTSKRAYRDALPKEEAIREILRHTGTQFCEEVVEAFVRALKKCGEYSEATEFSRQSGG